MKKQRWSFSKAVLTALIAVMILLPAALQAGSLEPPAGSPAPTMHTLEQIYKKLVSICSPGTGVTCAVVRGDGTCSSTETYTSAPEDCTCGNGTCDSGETCSGCVADCGACATCNNNGTCDTGSGETYANCPADCPCDNDGTCETGETVANCGADCHCNNDGTCDQNENIVSCLADCRFTLMYSGLAVRDDTSNIIWDKSPSTTAMTWSEAGTYCSVSMVGYGGQTDWRLPSNSELNGLLLPCYNNTPPYLPTGHPFLNIQNSTYWSATTYGSDRSTVDLSLAGCNRNLLLPPTESHYFWCVRTGP